MPATAADVRPTDAPTASGDETRPESPATPAVAVGAASSPWCSATVLVGLLALAVRVGVVLAQPIVLANDAADYQRLALSLVGGHGFGTSHFAPGGGPTALRPPLFPLVIAGVYKVVGHHLVAARLVEAALGALAVVLLTAATWLLWGRRVGIVAGVLAAVFPPQVMATTSLMSESVALPLELGALFCALAYRRSGRQGWAVTCGGALGLLVLTRPSLAVLIIPLGLLMARRGAWRRTALAVAALVLCATAVVVPWLIRDRLSLHAWVPLTTQSGYVLAGTYNATSAHDGGFPAAWRPAVLDATDATVLAHHPHAGEVTTDALLQRQAERYASAHPGYVITVAAENTRRLFDLVPQSQVRADTASEYGFPGQWGLAETVGGIGLLILALAGLACGAARAAPVGYLLAPVLLWLSTVVLQAVPRFRAVIDPFLLPLAAVAIVAVAGRLARRLPRRAACEGASAVAQA